MRMQWILVAVVLSVPAIYAIHTRAIQNPRVVRELTTDPGGPLAGRVLIVTLPSGKTIPINYLLERDAAGREIVHVASDFTWWRELRGKGARVEVLIRGQRRRGHARAIEDDPGHRSSVFARLRPTAPRWFGVLVDIELDPMPDPSRAGLGSDA